MADAYADVRSEARSVLAEQMRIDAARAKIPDDGKLRIATLTTGGMQIGLAFISYNAGRVIEDPTIIDMIEKLGIPFEILSGGAAIEAALPRAVNAKTPRAPRRGRKKEPVAVGEE